MADFINALQQGMSDQNAWQEGDTRRRAGNALASDGYGASSNILARGGMLPEAAAMRDRGGQEQASQAEAARKEQADKMKFGLQIFDALSYVPEDKRNDVLEHFVPTLEAMGLAAQVPALRAAPKDDASIQAGRMLWGAEADKLAFTSRGNGGYDVNNARTGAIVRSVEPTAKAERMRGPDGIYERNANGEWEKVESFGPAPRTFAPRRSGGGARGASSSVTAPRSYGSGAEPQW